MDKPTTAADQDGTDGAQPAPALIARTGRRRVMRNGAAVIAGVAPAIYIQPNMRSLGVPVSLAATSTVPLGLQTNVDRDAGQALTALQTLIDGEPRHDNKPGDGVESGDPPQPSGNSGSGGRSGGGGSGGGG